MIDKCSERQTQCVAHADRTPFSSGCSCERALKIWNAILQLKAFRHPVLTLGQKSVRTFVGVNFHHGNSRPAHKSSTCITEVAVSSGPSFPFFQGVLCRSQWHSALNTEKANGLFIDLHEGQMGKNLPLCLAEGTAICHFFACAVIRIRDGSYPGTEHTFSCINAYTVGIFSAESQLHVCVCLRKCKKCVSNTSLDAFDYILIFLSTYSFVYIIN